MDIDIGYHSDIWSSSTTVSDFLGSTQLAADATYDISQVGRSIEDSLQGLTAVIKAKKNQNMIMNDQKKYYEKPRSYIMCLNATIPQTMSDHYGSYNEIENEIDTFLNAKNYIHFTDQTNNVNNELLKDIFSHNVTSYSCASQSVFAPEYSKFFVIKSFNIENIKLSFQNNIWSSTKRGNKKLSTEYSKLKPGAKIFLLFSVNKSGKFCGVAEMTSNLIHNDPRSNIWSNEVHREFPDLFQVKWLFARDIHNKLLKHFNITDSDGTFKPITHSRDVDQVSLEIGRTLLKMFANENITCSFLSS